MEIHICQTCGHLVHRRTSVCESCGVPSEGNVITMDAGAAEKMNRSFSGDPQLAVKTMKVIFEKEMPSTEEVSYNNSPAVAQFRTGIWSTVGDQTQSAGFTGLLTGAKNGKVAPASPQPPKQNDAEQAARAAREKEKRQQELERQQREQAEFEEQQQEYERRRRERAELARQQHYQNHNDQPGNATNEAGLSHVENQREELERAEYERQQKEYERKLAEYQQQQAEYEKQQAEYEKQQAEFERQQAERAEFERQQAERAEFERQQAERAEFERQQAERAEFERQQAERAEFERQQAERAEFERQQAERAEFERQQADLESHQAETITHSIDEHNAELQNLSEEERAEYLAQLREFELQRAEYEQIKMEVEGEQDGLVPATSTERELEDEPGQQYDEAESTQVEQTEAVPEVTGEALISKFMDQLFDSSNMESGPEYSVEFDPASTNSLEQMHANLHSSGSQGMLAEQISSTSSIEQAGEQTTSGNFRMQKNDRQAAFGAVTMESVRDTSFESSLANQHAHSLEAPQATPRGTNSSIDRIASKSDSVDAFLEAEKNNQTQTGDNYYSSPDIEKFETGTFNTQTGTQAGSGSYDAIKSSHAISKDVDDQQDDLYQTSEQQKLRRDNQDSSGGRDFSTENAQTTSGKFDNQFSSGRNLSISPATNSEMRKTTGGLFNMEVEVSRQHLTAASNGAEQNDVSQDGRISESTQYSSANQSSPRASNSKILPFDSTPDKLSNEAASSPGLKSPLLSKQLEKRNEPPAKAFKKVVLPLIIAAGAFAFLAGIMLLRVPTGLAPIKDKPALAGKGAPAPSDITPSEPGSSQATVRDGTRIANGGGTGPAEVAPIGSNSTGQTPDLLDVANGPTQSGSGLNLVQNNHAAQPMQQMPAQPMQQMPSQPMQQMPMQPVQQMPAQPIQQMPVQPMQQVPVQPTQQLPAQPTQQLPVQPTQQLSAQPLQQVPVQPTQQLPAQPTQQLPKRNVRPQAVMKVETTSMTGKWDYGYQNPTGSTGYGAIQIKQDGVNLRGSGTDSSGAFQIKGVRQGDIIAFDKLYVRNGVAISKRIMYSGKLSIYNEPGVGPAMLMSGIWRYSGHDSNGKEKTMSGQFEGKLAR